MVRVATFFFALILLAPQSAHAGSAGAAALTVIQNLDSDKVAAAAKRASEAAQAIPALSKMKKPEFLQHVDPKQAAETAKGVAKAVPQMRKEYDKNRAAGSARPPMLKVMISLTSVELGQMVELLWDFMQTPEGRQLLEMIKAGNMPSPTQAWNNFFAKFETWKEENMKEIPALGFLKKLKGMADLDVSIEYNKNALERMAKKKIDQYFLSHTFTNFGRRHPRLGRRIRYNQVSRPNSIYNRMVPPYLANAHTMVRAQANRQLVDMSKEIEHDTGVRNKIVLNAIPNDRAQRGFYNIKYGDELLAKEFLPQGGPDNKEMLATLRKVSRRMNEEMLARR